MFLCYIDESGTPDIPGNSSHFILAGISIPIDKWKECDSEISAIKSKYSLSGVEIHTAWMLRHYLEQNSQLTSMVQIADLCSYVLRRYLENDEDKLFDLIFRIADRKTDGTVVGVRHFTNPHCICKICSAHRKK